MYKYNQNLTMHRVHRIHLTSDNKKNQRFFKRVDGANLNEKKKVILFVNWFGFCIEIKNNLLVELRDENISFTQIYTN